MAACMGRRALIAGLAGTALFCPLCVNAQQAIKKIPIIGILWHAGSAEEEDVYLSVVRRAFAELGYVEGKSIRLENRFPAEQPARFQALAQELVAIKCDVIIGVTAIGTRELEKLTGTIPIVFVLVADPVGFGFVDSLARPGRNATGLSLMTNDLSGKRLGLLKEAIPVLSRVALLVDRTDAFRERAIKAHQAAAEALGISLWSIELASPDDIEPAFAKVAQDRADAVVWGIGSMLFNERARMGASVLKYKLPVLVSIAEEVPHGLLMSYGQDYPDFFRRGVAYTDKIIKGAKPADLPVEQPTKFKLVLNLKAAKAIGITVPSTLLTTADEVIE